MSIPIDSIIDQEHQEASPGDNLPKEFAKDKTSSDSVKSTKKYI